ncbi:MAG: hypothetical protein AVDCRST_MAG48-709, partial [uncultured Friedmanniella sp.]
WPARRPRSRGSPPSAWSARATAWTGWSRGWPCCP